MWLCRLTYTVKVGCKITVESCSSLTFHLELHLSNDSSVMCLVSTYTVNVFKKMFQVVKLVEIIGSSVVSQY